LTTWLSAGAKRTETSAGSKTYANATAVQIMDAWWPLLVQGEFQPGLGTTLYNALTADLPIDESPSAAHGPTGAHAGSSFQYGWWSYVDKDIRKVLGQPVQGPLAQTYCGGGVLSACRDVLLSTLKQARRSRRPPSTRATPVAAPPVTSGGADSIIQRPLGGITDDRIAWQNRPTFQQVVEFPAHR